MESIPPIKRHRLIDWLHKQGPTFCCIQETHLSDKEKHFLRAKAWKTIFQAVLRGKLIALSASKRNWRKHTLAA
jgi:hypothetical protein